MKRLIKKQKILDKKIEALFDHDHNSKGEVMLETYFFENAIGESRYDDEEDSLEKSYIQKA